MPKLTYFVLTDPPNYQEVLYYCDVSDDSTFEIHRGNKYGPVVAKSRRCRMDAGATDVLLAEPLPAARSSHIHHDEHTCKTHFTANGQRYHWNGRIQLVEDKTGTVLAQLSLVSDTHKRNGGKLIIKPEGYFSQKLTDPIIMSAMVVQERFDEGRSWF